MSMIIPQQVERKGKRRRKKDQKKGRVEKVRRKGQRKKQTVNG
jgi:hypothetical protein